MVPASRPSHPPSYPSGRLADVHDLRVRSPRWLRDRARQVALEWGHATATWRSMPTLIIIGAQRSGTTSLYRYLARQDAVATGLTKEVRYFDLHYDRGERWYRAHFPTRQRLATIAHRVGVSPAVCEASPGYLYHPEAPARLAAAVPDARLVAMLRNPVERAHSHYQHERALGFEQLSFEAALDAERERLTSGRLDMRFAHQHYSYCARGRYHEQVERWLRVFDRSQLLIITSEELFANPERVVNDVLQHAGLPVGARGPFPAQNSLAYEAIPPDLRDRLAREFAPHSEALAGSLGRAFGWA